VHRLFAPLIAPLLEAAKPRTVVETGAGSGRLTRRLLESEAIAGARIHAIDPAPALDPVLVEAAADRLSVHAERAVSALPRIGAVELAILDGDPSWHAVHSELSILIAAAARAGEPAPLVLVHNVHWPFGRRDGYYEPEAIPADRRAELSELGLVPGRREPVAGGLRLTPFCAARDFAPRSGVLTAVEDVIESGDLEWTLIEVPGFHGCAVMVEAERLRALPTLAPLLEGFRAGGFLARQVRRAETARLELAIELAALRQEEPPPESVEEPQDAAAEPPSPASEPDSEPEPREQLEAEGERSAELEAELDRRSAEIVALREQKLALQESVAEHSAQREALEWQVERLDQDLAARDRRIEDLTEERDRERVGLAELRVRLEQAATDLEVERDAAARAVTRAAELEAELLGRQRELESLAERESLAQGRLSHREEALQATSAEVERLRGEVAALRAELEAGRQAMGEVARRVEEAGATRWARLGSRFSRIGRALRPGGGDRPPLPIELAMAAAQRGLPGPGRDDQSQGELGEIEARVADSAVRQPR
jgi:hypothetical protein